MRRTSLMPALLALATVLFSGTPSEGAFVIYREIFPNDTTDNIFSVTAKPETGWTVHLGSSGTEQPVTNDGSTWHISRNALDTSATAAVAVNSDPQRVPLGNRGYLWQGTGGSPQILWTSEFTVDRSLWNVAEINWWQQNSAVNTPVRVAVEIGGDWYASSQDFGGTGTVARSLDFSTADWHSLNFTPGSSLALGSATTLPGTGDITAFGWFTENRTNTLRLDSFEIRAESTAPVTNRLITSLVPNSTYQSIALWLDASDVHGVGAPNPADGTTVAFWTDKVNAWSAAPASGSGTVAYQATVAGLGGQPAVELDQREMTIPDASLQTALNPGTEPFTVFAVGASHTAADNDSMWVRKGNSGSANAGWSVMAGNQGAAVRANDSEGSNAIGDRTSQRNAGLALNQFGVVTLELSGIDPGTGQGVLTGRLNGTNTGWSFGGIGPGANHTYYDASITTNNLLTLGRTDAKSTLAEVLIYPGGLTPVQTLMVERYLGAKYGIPLNYDGPEQIIYQETFDNTTGSDQPLSTAGWKIHWGDGEPIPDGAGGAVVSMYGFAIDLSGNTGDFLYWTEEFSFNLDSHVVTRVTWDNTANASDAVRFAMQIDDNWYVSDDSFARGPGDLDFLNTTWQPLSFEPGEMLERPGTATGLSILELGGTRVTAFGLYDDYGVRHRFDNITIYAAIPEPSTALLALTGLAVLGLLRRRRVVAANH